MKEKTCCCTGHRPHGFLWEYEKISKEQTLYLSLLKKATESLIQDNGITRFFSGMALSNDNLVIVSEKIVFDISNYDCEDFYGTAEISANYTIKNKGTAVSTKMAIPYIAKPHAPAPIMILNGNDVIPFTTLYGNSYFKKLLSNEDIQKIYGAKMELSGTGTLYTYKINIGIPFSVEMNCKTKQAVFHNGYNSSTSHSSGKFSLRLDKPITDSYSFFVSDGDLADEPKSDFHYVKTQMTYAEYFDSLYIPMCEVGFIKTPKEFYWSKFVHAVLSGQKTDIISDFLHSENNLFECLAVFEIPISENSEMSFRVNSKATVQRNNQFAPPVFLYRYSPSFETNHAFSYKFVMTEEFPFIIESDIALLKSGKNYLYDGEVLPKAFNIIFSSEEKPVSLYPPEKSNDNDKILKIVCYSVGGVAIIGLIFSVMLLIQNKRKS